LVTSLGAAFANRLTFPFQRLVQKTVTIIVFVIALFYWSGSAFIAIVSLPFIYHIIAIVVFKVAYFLCWLSRVAPFNLTIYTYSSPGPALAVASEDALVNFVIAIVVPIVA